MRVTEKRDLWKDIHVWIWCVNQAGKEGWVPEPYLEVDGSSGTGNRDYDAVELDIEEGEYLDVLDEVNGWCWCRDTKGKTGWVPTENVRIFTA